ncbi:forkhead box protein H1 [Osmerus eperlanus]|uniref:forkhead box protein H1 n=1 Tax=Osmerus eperlanus TaxID=29151 RepID=UPI002E121701
MAENFGTYQTHQVPPSGAVHRRRYQKGTTYLALITQVLQDSPDRMLTFTEMMQKIKLIVSGDRKGLENNIRVCLSTNSCFIKVPMRTDMPLAKKNYWKVDESRITEKMVRRHFKGILEQSPVLSSTVKIENRPVELCVTDSPTPAAHHAQKKHEMKFSSSFSIESLLRRNCPTHLGPRHAPPSVVCSASVRAEQLPWREERAVGMKRRLSWDCPPVHTHCVPRAADSYCIYTTGGDIDRGFHAYSARPTTRVCVESNIRSMAEYTKSSLSPHFMIGTHIRCAQYPASEYDYDVQHLRL